jgi:hypothetical protein
MKRLIIILIIILVALAIFFFPKTSGWGGEQGVGDIVTRCNCLGFESYSYSFEKGERYTCYGIPYDCESYTLLDILDILD